MMTAKAGRSPHYKSHKGPKIAPWQHALVAVFLWCGANAETLDLKVTCHAAGDGAVDDATALKTCLTMLAQQTE